MTNGILAQPGILRDALKNIIMAGLNLLKIGYHLKLYITKLA